MAVKAAAVAAACLLLLSAVAAQTVSAPQEAAVPLDSTINQEVVVAETTPENGVTVTWDEVALTDNNSPPFAALSDGNIPSNNSVFTVNIPQTIYDPQQIRLAFGQAFNPTGSVYVVWVTGNSTYTKGAVGIPPAKSTTESVVSYGVRPELLTSMAIGAPGETYTHTDGNSTAFLSTYVSGYIHMVELKDLEPSTTYWYSVGGIGPDNKTHFSSLRKFSTPAAVGTTYPLRIGIVADVGITYNSSATLDHLKFSLDTWAGQKFAMLVGDLNYADNIDHDGVYGGPNGGSYPPRWDDWGRISDKVFAYTPLLTCAGNHEIEPQHDNTTFLSWTKRVALFQPYNYSTYATAPSNIQWYSYEISGAHVIFLGGFATTPDGNVDWKFSGPQYKWLVADLAAVNRTLTPWIIVNFHQPYYHTYSTSHYKEAECLRNWPGVGGWEDLFYKYEVAVVLHGHVHAYQRSKPMYAYEIDPKGAVYITVGDGGNDEGMVKYNVDTNATASGDLTDTPMWQPPGSDTSAYMLDFTNATNPGIAYLPTQPSPHSIGMPFSDGDYPGPVSCITFQYKNGTGIVPQPGLNTTGNPYGLILPPLQATNGTGWYSYLEAPLWNAHREPSFGHGTLDIISATEAVWTWHRNQDNYAIVGDQVIIANPYTPPAAVAAAPAPAPAAGATVQSAG